MSFQPLAQRVKHTPRKRFGQHFLHDPRVISRIIDAINPQQNEILVEIGPGLGALTQPLLETGCNIIALDIDRDVLAALETLHISPERLQLIEADALKFDFVALSQKLNRPLRVIGNLPYNISTPLLFHLLSASNNIADMHFMLQKEVIDRMVAVPANKTYGRLSVMVQAKAMAESLFDIGPGAFKPPPKVTSSMVRIIPSASATAEACDPSTFSAVVSSAFNQRRKTCRNALKAYLNEADWMALGIDPVRRPETLSVAEFTKIANRVSSRVVVQTNTI